MSQRPAGPVAAGTPPLYRAGEKPQPSTPELAVVIPTYNRRQQLALTLQALVDQRAEGHRYEVVVADDGSRDGTSKLVRSFRGSLPIRYHYQQDRGFRAAAARNAGARLSSAPVLAFLDSGTVPGPDFVSAHLAAQAEGGRAVVGYTYGYDNLPSGDTLALLERLWQSPPTQVRNQYQDHPRFRDARHQWFAHVNFDLSQYPAPWECFWSVNISVRAADFWAVGGYDERFQGYGMEDIDLGFRLHLHRVSFMVSQAAWAIEGPQSRDVGANEVSNRRNTWQFLRKYRHPATEVWAHLIATQRSEAFQEVYARTLAGARAVTQVDVSSEIREAVFGSPATHQVLVIGAGGIGPDVHTNLTLVEFEEVLVKQLRRHSRQQIVHGLGVHTRFEDRAFDVVVITARLAPLWSLWGDTLLAEASRVGRRVWRSPVIARSGGRPAKNHSLTEVEQ